MVKRARLIIILIIALAPAVVLAAYPKPTGYVNDFAGVITPETKAKLEGLIASFEKSTGNEIAVATLPSLDEQPIEDVAVELFKEWGIGKKAKDNGILFLVAPGERKMRIEVGYGLEGAINDALAGRILDQAVIPRFRAGDMDGGIAAGTLAIVGVISKKENLGFDAEGAYGEGAAVLATVVKKKSSMLGMIGKVIFFLIMAFVFIRHPWLFLFFLGSMGGRSGGVSSGGFSGGFGGFGGGMSGGGGASRGW